MEGNTEDRTILQAQHAASAAFIRAHAEKGQLREDERSAFAALVSKQAQAWAAAGGAAAEFAGAEVLAELRGAPDKARPKRRKG